MTDAQTERMNRANAVIDAVARSIGGTYPDLVGTFRQRTLSESRQVAWWILYNRLFFTAPEIGAIFNRTHATILYGLKQVNGRRKKSPTYRQQLDHFVTQVIAPDPDEMHTGHA